MTDKRETVETLQGAREVCFMEIDRELWEAEERDTCRADQNQ